MKIRSSVRGLGGAFATPAVLVLAGTGGLHAHPGSGVALVVVGAGITLGGIALYDYPIRLHVDEIGIVRRCVARSHLLTWDSIAALEECRDGSLVAVTMRGRRYLLSDRTPGPLVAHLAPDSVTVRRRRRQRDARRSRTDPFSNAPPTSSSHNRRPTSIGSPSSPLE